MVKTLPKTCLAPLRSNKWFYNSKPHGIAKIDYIMRSGNMKDYASLSKGRNNKAWATYYDDKILYLVLTLQEVYFLFVILIVPTGVMGFSYGKIIIEICKVVKQRYHLTQSSATERKTSEVQAQQQIEMTPFQKVSEGADVPLAQSQGTITEEHEIKIATETEEPINQPKMDNDTKQVKICEQSEFN